MLIIFVIIRHRGFFSIAYIIGMIKTKDPETSSGRQTHLIVAQTKRETSSRPSLPDAGQDPELSCLPSLLLVGFQYCLPN
uniref:Uncharacterized protein n=1 Tax=Pseudoalteromonas citrea DSM 8771 TaxID=1117314 RepID=U1JHM0_9GAMM